MHEALYSETHHFFPRSARYDTGRVVRNSSGENVLCNLESPTQILSVKPGMRVPEICHYIRS